MLSINFKRNRNFALGLAMLASGAANAQKNELATLQIANLQMYHNALKSGDGPLAINALSYVVAADPQSTYRDTLAMLYYHTERPQQALYWIEQHLVEKPANAIGLTELKAQCLLALGDRRSAIPVLEDLVKAKPAISSLWWQLAGAQFDLRRQAEALASLQQLEKLPADTLAQVPYSPDNKVMKYTTISAAAANMKGIILYEMKQNGPAKAAFEQAARLDANYSLPAQNLAAMESKADPVNRGAIPAAGNKAKGTSGAKS